jgi:putative FmdB family regulatory protein
MPTYEYLCAKCGASTEVMATVAEKEAGLKPVCPACGSTKMVQSFGQISVLGRGRSGPSGCTPRSGCCG